MPRRASVRSGLVVLLVLVCVPAVSAQASDLYVDPANGACSDGASLATASNPGTPWCSASPATRLARPGDVVHLADASYPALRPATSGLAGQPIVYVGDTGATIAPPAGAVGVMLIGVHDLVLRNVRIIASANQGVAIDNSQGIVLDHDTVSNGGGSGVWVKAASAVTVTACALVGNASAGLFDSQYASGTRLLGSTVSGNGIDGRQYGGDGVELDGSNEVVRSSTITGNGDGVGFEHGIYVGETATGYTITGNQISGNAGADIKATGGAGVIAYNTLGSGMWGLVLSDNSTLVTVEYNLVQGRFQHGIFLTTGSTAARARLLNNTVEQTGRLTSSGDASAVFVASATQLVLRNDLLSYTNPDALGSALFVNSASLLASFDSQTNWFSSTDRLGRDLAWNGSRVTLAAWRTLSSHDVASIDSAPPTFDQNGRVSSANLGAGAGTALGLSRDLVGTPLPAGVAPDIGAYQSLAR
jgi:hypothetical protein